MNTESTISSNASDFSKEIFESVLTHPLKLETYLNQDLTLSYVKPDASSHELKSCYGDILKTINALMDYARILDLVCDQWGLIALHKATYEYQANKLREIAQKFQIAIGYDYNAAVEKYQKNRARLQRSNDVGEDALTVYQNLAERKAEKNKRKLE